MVFYTTAALLYPKFFNPTKLFFCDLMQIRIGTEDSFNKGLPFALLALLSISTVMAAFFIWFTNQTEWSNNKKKFTKICGSSAAFFTSFIFTELHDEFILIASIIGGLPVTFVALEILKSRYKNAPVLGLISFLFLAFYNFSFYLNIFESVWPLMQKMSITLCLLWVNILTFKKTHLKFF